MNLIIHLTALSLIFSDPARDVLERNSEKWFICLVVSTCAVFLGVILEAPEGWLELIDWARARRQLKWARSRNGVFSDIDPAHWTKAVSFLGLALVLLGVIGEGIFEVLSSRADAAVRTYDETAIESANQKARDAATSAHNAAIDAGNAHTLAQGASDTAGAAQKKADAIGEKANDLDKQLDIAKTQLADAQAEEEKERRDLINLAVCSAPRVIPVWSIGRTGPTSNPTTNLDPLRPFARHVIVEFVPDAEARRAASNLVSALGQAGWSVDRATPREGLTDGVAIQMYTVFHQQPGPLGQDMQDAQSHVRATEAADALTAFLHSYNWQALPELPPHGTVDIPPDGLKILIGLYPPVTFVSPPGLKDVAKRDAEREKSRKDNETKIEERDQKIDEELLKQLTPQQALKFKATRERINAERKASEELYSGPCQTMGDPSAANP